MNTDVTSILRLNDSAGRVLLIFYGIGTSTVAILNLHGMLVPWAGVACIALLWAGTGWMLGRSQDEMRARNAAIRRPDVPTNQPGATPDHAGIGGDRRASGDVEQVVR